MSFQIIISRPRSFDGDLVIEQSKDEGMNKGRIVLAIIPKEVGGNLGTWLVATTAARIAEHVMADEIVVDLDSETEVAFITALLPVKA